MLAAISAENLAARTILAASAGITVDPQDPSEVCRFARLLIDDEDRRARFGAAALSYARAHFEIDSIAGRFDEIFLRLTGAGSAAAERPSEIATSFL